jgi:hypothetical protein
MDSAVDLITNITGSRHESAGGFVKADKNMVAEFLTQKGLTATEFQKQERSKGKTPDFRVLYNGAFAFFCEVKTIQKDMIEGLRDDPVFNRLTDDIHTAVKQFDAVNQKVEAPNVLTLINHDQSCGLNDLISVLTGNFIAENDQPSPIYKQFSEGRIKDEKARIHLFLWLDDFKPERFLFTQTHIEFHKQLCGWFRVDPNGIKQIRF